jgi:hypothetical protein
MRLAGVPDWSFAFLETISKKVLDRFSGMRILKA